MSNSSELPHDLLICVAERIQKLKDFIAFGAVCKAWHAAGKKEYFKGLWLQQEKPYMMLPVRDDNDDAREFYSLVEGEIVASIRISKFKSRKCHESLGWLLAVEEDGSMCLLDPFSSVEIPVPHQRTFPEYNQCSKYKHVSVKKMVLSARPSETSDFIVMIIYGGFRHLVFWRPGDKSWNKIEMQSGWIWDVMYHGGHFYAIGDTGSAWVFTLERDNPPKGQIVTRFYILKTSQSLFMISRTKPCLILADHRWCYNTTKFYVYEVDMSIGTWAEINNLGSLAIFIVHNATFVVDASDFSGTIKGNRIYFTDDGWELCRFYEETEKGDNRNMGAYNMETGTVELFYPGQMLL